MDWLAADPTGSGDPDFLIIGDLNSYDKEDPIDAILAGGYTDLIIQFIGEDAYSYVFDGQIRVSGLCAGECRSVARSHWRDQSGISTPMKPT